MQQHKEQYKIAKMAKVFRISRSGYYDWILRNPSKHDQDDIALSEIIEKIFKKHRSRYGSPRIFEELKSLGWRVGRKRVERLMREQKLWSRPRQKWTTTTDSNHEFSVADNILDRNFTAEAAGEKWVSDICYLRTNSGWLYLTIILDLWDRKVIGWSISKDLKSKSVCAALEMAVGNRLPREGLIFHSDRGVQYCSDNFIKTLKRLCPRVRQSMSRKGNCWDNACAESFFKTLKVELDYLNGNYSHKEVKLAIFEYIEIYYNRCRRHSALGYAIPVALTNNFAA